MTLHEIEAAAINWGKSTGMRKMINPPTTSDIKNTYVHDRSHLLYRIKLLVEITPKMVKKL